jgi:hypothetical protein
MPLVPALRRDVPPLDANILKDLVEGGGHGEMPAAAQQQSLSALIEARLINRVVYRAGLVVHEITDAGRRYIRDMSA